MDTIIDLKASYEDFDVEFEVLPLTDTDNIKDERLRRIAAEISDIDKKLTNVQDKIARLDTDIDRLTSHADGADYAIAVTSGIITGIIDAVVVGEWNFENAKAKSNENLNNKVTEFAKKMPTYNLYCTHALEGKGTPRKKPKDPNRLETAIGFLEYKFKLPGDGAYTTDKYGISGKSHRIDDFCHHPTLAGLVCSVLVQFSGSTQYVLKGEKINIPVEINEYGNFVGKNTVTKLFSGVINWVITCAKTVANQKGHIMSDMATSAGVPGSFLSFIYELASLPCFKETDALTKLRNSYINGIGNGKNQLDLGAFNALFEGAQSKLTMATEGAVKHELKRQAIPVVLNEVLVRASYFIRRFIFELREKQSFETIEWKNIIPFNNRTIVRMMTVASGTFTAIDMADAAIHAATKSADASTFCANMLLRVNFVGVGRFTVAVASDIGMGGSRQVKINRRINLRTEQIFLSGAKVYYKQAGMWIAAENTAQALEDAYTAAKKSAQIFADALEQDKQSLNDIGDMVPAIEEKNPGLIDKITKLLGF